MTDYVPDAGDLVWLDFDPRAGHEQSGRRPALVLSPRTYNAAARLAVVCPLTKQIKGYPFEVPLVGVRTVKGAVLSDHLKSIDWHARRAEYAGKVGASTIDQVRDHIRTLLAL